MLGLAGWAVWDESASQTEVRMGREQNAAQHIEYAQDRVRQACLDLDPAALLECITVEVISANDHSRAESDLDAQQAMALWAKLMTLASVAGTGFTAVGIYLVWGTLTETRKATGAAQASVAAAIADRRPWLKLTLNVVGVVTFDGKEVRVTVAWEVKNVGRSPAEALNVHISGAPFAHSPTARSRARDWVTQFTEVKLSTVNITLFPGDTVSDLVNIPLSSGNEMPAFGKLFAEGSCMPQVCAYVGYRMSQHGEIMTTNVCVDLHRKSTNGLGFRVDELPISAEEFKLSRSMFTEDAT